MRCGEPITVQDLIERLVRRLQQKLGLPADCVFETLADDQDHCDFPLADRFVTVTPQRFQQVPGLWAGGGRFTPGYDAVFRVACLCRFASDQELRNTRELRDKTRAAVALNLKVVDCLSGWQVPTVADETAAHLREPLRNIDFDFRPKRPKNSGPWAVVASQWDAKFVLALPSGTDPT